jgi:hypothetical protein
MRNDGRTNTSATSVRAEHAGADPPEVDRELRGERPWRELGESQALLVVLRRDPAPPLHEVALHVAAERDGATEPERPKADKIAQQIS